MFSTEWLSYSVLAASIIVGVGEYGLIIQLLSTGVSLGNFSITFVIISEIPFSPVTNGLTTLSSYTYILIDVVCSGYLVATKIGTIKQS